MTLSQTRRPVMLANQVSGRAESRAEIVVKFTLIPRLRDCLSAWLTYNADPVFKNFSLTWRR